MKVILEMLQNRLGMTKMGANTSMQEEVKSQPLKRKKSIKVHENRGDNQ